MLVRVTKQIGETGLRLPGTLFLLNDELGQKWIQNGWAVEVDQYEIEGKELKTDIETKQEKFKVKEKETKRKRVTKTKLH
jgi:type II secretory pathway component PulK